jgi:uncharacterized protein
MRIVTALLSRLRTGSAALLASMAFALPAAAEPAMWVVKDRDSTIYLFGTVHVLKPETQWLSPKIEAAVAQSDELWLEVPITSRADLREAMLPLVKLHGLSRGKPLSARLTPEELQMLQAASRRAGLPPDGFDIFRPWFAALGIGAAAQTSAGYDREAGADARIHSMFAKRGISAHGFETTEDQLRIFTELSEEEELRYLRAAFEAHVRAPKDADVLVQCWINGDLETMEAGIVLGMKAGDPLLYEKLISRRNVAWARTIEEMLAGSGTAFIAVGAAHLLGPDSIQAQLARSEIRAERV